MLLHALVLDLLNRVGSDQFVNVDVDVEVLRVLAVLIYLIFQLSNLFLGALGDIVGLNLIALALLIIFAFIIYLNLGEGLDSQAQVFIAEAHLLHATTQLPQLAAALDCAVLLTPSRGVLTRAPNMVLKAILDLLLVADNDVLVAEIMLYTSAALLVVHFNLEVLVAVKIK